MKNILKFLTFLLITTMVSCKRDKIVTPNDFNVKTDKTIFSVGDTVNFSLSGNPDEIVFYSGLPGSQYENSNRLLAKGVNKLTFQSSMSQGLLANVDSLRLLVSKDLNGYDAVAIAAAKWTDITDRNTKWPKSLTTAYTTSDAIDISDFNTSDKINIAFRVRDMKYPAHAQRKWAVQNLTLNNLLPDGTNTALFSTFANTGWVQVSVKNNNLGFNSWNVGDFNQSASTDIRNSTGVTIRNAYPITFDPGTTVNNDENDDWLITSAIDLKKTKPDAGTVIKSYLDLPMKAYQFVLKTDGVFKVTFVGINNNDDTQKSVARDITITVNP